MMHFVFKLADTGAIMYAYSQQDLPGLLGLPLLGVVDGSFCVLPLQHSNFDLKMCAPQLDRLPAQLKSMILSAVL
jgi:hypothetical protein